jgi:glycosyltransferase involved in cell wall biosynthesis
MKIALCLIVKSSNEEALLLNRCLDSIAPYVDGIFVTRTTKKEERKNAAVANVVKNFNAHLSDFDWIDDFAAARNFNFSQVPKDYDYILWCDADDIWRGLEKLRDTIKENEHADGFGFWYLYDWDEHKKPVVVHRKTMIIKNDGAATWVGALHEDLQPNRQLRVALIEGIERLHLTDKKRSAANAERNLKIAKKMATSDPREYWNLANAQFSVSDFKGSRETFEKFIKESHSSEEIYLAHTRLANVYKALSRREECVRELQIAIGLNPALPDAYLQLAAYLYDFGDMDKAEQYCLQGMVKRPQIMKMIVYNPRDYDYNPMMLLAKIYAQKSRPDLMLPVLKGCLKIYPNDEKLLEYVKEGEKDKEMLARALRIVQKLQKITDKEKLKKELDKVPEDLRSHPAIAVIRNENFIKTESSGKDLVIYCGNTIEQWNPELAKTKMVGGSEEAVIYNARELAKLGWNVTVYNNCGHKEIKTENVTYKPFWEFNYRDKQDVAIIWRWPKALDAPINASKIFLDLHDVVSEGEFTEKRLERVTKIFVKSKFHRSLFPNVPNNKIEIIPNGVEMNLDPTIKRDPYLIINTSSPDRSMDVMPKLFKQIKKRVPKAKMAWCYGWEGFVNAHQSDSKKMEWMEYTKKAIKDAGIEDLGRLSQEEVGKLYQKAGVFAYPSEFAEIFCISVLKAQAAGALAITSDFAALKEMNITGLTTHSKKNKDNWNRPYQFFFGMEDEEQQEKWVDMIVESLKIKRKPVELTVDFSWTKIAQMWDNILK